MKTIVAPDGGRPGNNNDFLLLQGEALKGYIALLQNLPGQFVVSGCAITPANNGLYNIAGGLVWIDGKLREFPGTLAPVSLPCYLEAHDTVEEQRVYEDGVSRDAVINYGARVSAAPYVEIDEDNNQGQG
jgi:hypothetical protein